MKSGTFNHYIHTVTSSKDVLQKDTKNLSNI